MNATNRVRRMRAEKLRFLLLVVGFIALAMLSQVSESKDLKFKVIETETNSKIFSAKR